MLTKEQIEAIEKRADNYAVLDTDIMFRDIHALLSHVRELTQQAFCEHTWNYTFNEGFKCSKCLRTKEKK